MTVTSSRTNGFLFADLRDYTRYVESHGDRAAAALLDAYRELVRAAVAEFGGAEIKTEGDSFYVVFPSASSAVQCGLAILEAASKSTAAGGAPIAVGIGVHAGETVETAEGYVGSAVNVAARVCSQAKPGELLVTDTVRALTRTFLPVKFTDRRVRKLKGIEESVTLYRVQPAVEQTMVAPKKKEPASGVGRTARVAFLLVGLLIGGAAAGYVLLAATRPPTGPAETATPGADASFPTAAEADLLDKLSSQLSDRCVREADARPRGAIASLRCDLELSAEADTVRYNQFETQQDIANHLNSVVHDNNLTGGTCGPGVPRADGNWAAGGTFSGRLLCYQSEGGSWIVWTYDADRILAQATRGGVADDDWAGLYEWWSQMRLFMR